MNLLTSCRGVEGAYELPHRIGEAGGALKILRNCLSSTPQSFYSMGVVECNFWIAVSKTNLPWRCSLSPLDRTSLNLLPWLL